MVKFLRDSYKMLRIYMKNMKMDIFLLLLFTGINIGIQLIYPKLTQNYIDSIVYKKPSLLITIGICFFGLIVLRIFSDIFLTLVSQKISWKTTNTLRVHIIKHILSLDMKELSNIEKGEMIQKIDGDVDSLFTFFSNLFVNMAISILMLIGINLILLESNIFIGFIFISYTILAFIIFAVVNKKSTKVWVQMKEEQTKVVSFFGEIFNCYDNLSGFKSSYIIQNKLNKILISLYPMFKESALVGYKLWTTSIEIFSIGNIIALAISGYLWYIGKISTGTVYMIFAYTDLLSSPIENLRMQLENIQVSSASIERIQAIFYKKSDIRYGELNEVLDTPIGVQLENLVFSYGEDKILNGVNFKIKPGEIVGIIGRTGCGKTTIAKLLSRLYEYSDGDILINNNSIKKYSNNFIRENIYFISQNNYFFYGTLKENLTVFKTDVADEKIVQAIKHVGMNEWYTTLKYGLETVINPNQIGLSQGELQLLAISRAFIKQPKLLILDEISSKLDPYTESKILDSIKKCNNIMTCIIITHRKNTLSIVNKLITIKDGKVNKIKENLKDNLCESMDENLIDFFEEGE